jgi:hypothetical protein
MEQILLYRPLKFENENKSDESPNQWSGDSLYCKDVRHKEFKMLISEPHLVAERLMWQLWICGTTKYDPSNTERWL